MKRRIKVMAAMLACLAVLATAAPSQAMQQAAAAAGASTTVNDMSYVYPMDCGLVYDTACFSTGHYTDAAAEQYQGNHWGSGAMMINDIDYVNIKAQLENIGIEGEPAVMRYVNIFNDAIAAAYKKWGDVITKGGNAVELQFGVSSIANQAPGRTETQQDYASEGTAAGNAAPNGLEEIGATSTPGEDNEPEPPSSAPIPSLPLTQETDQATSLLPDGPATGAGNDTTAWMEETPAASTLTTGEPENAEDERTTTAYEPTKAPDEEEATGPQETLTPTPPALVETAVTAPDTPQQSQPVPEGEPLSHSPLPTGQPGASGPEEANANSDSEGERLMVTDRGGNHGTGNVCIKINLEGLLNQGYIGPNLTDDQMKTHLANMLAHEMGHMLGMTHSIKMTDKKPSIMWPTYAIGEDRSAIESDKAIARYLTHQDTGHTIDAYTFTQEGIPDGEKSQYHYRECSLCHVRAKEYHGGYDLSLASEITTNLYRPSSDGSKHQKACACGAACWNAPEEDHNFPHSGWSLLTEDMELHYNTCTAPGCAYVLTQPHDHVRIMELDNQKE